MTARDAPVTGVAVSSVLLTLKLLVTVRLLNGLVSTGAPNPDQVTRVQLTRELRALSESSTMGAQAADHISTRLTAALSRADQDENARISPLGTPGKERDRLHLTKTVPPKSGSQGGPNHAGREIRTATPPQDQATG
ncbi:hypothetical protein DEDE109153_15135 [Deinococcus deserti]|nr:hypothetical protein [Deinococcus deserti]